MRLIDAHALYDVLGERRRHASDSHKVAIQDAIKIIGFAPTIDPVKRAEWLYMQMIDGDMNGECSSWHKVRIVDNYCPNCGAKMIFHDEIV